MRIIQDEVSYPSSRYEVSMPLKGRTYYRRAGVCVTGQALIVGGEQYDIARLGDMRTTRGPRDSVAIGAPMVMAIVMLCIGVAMPWRHPLSALVVATAITLVPAGFAIAVWKARGRSYKLWADYQGSDICLLEMSGSEHYGQICRALIRATEARTAALQRDARRASRGRVR